MSLGSSLRSARRRAGLSQRGLAARSGVAQPTIARIERNQDDPRVSTVERLLLACDEVIEVVPRAGLGVDRTQIQELLRRSPGQRLVSLVEEAPTLEALDRGHPIG
ncbi:MAG: helix-turn-helix domain-containing protein [Acidimicrobiales bacterium]